jgi:hypothetical protein
MSNYTTGKWKEMGLGSEGYNIYPENRSPTNRITIAMVRGGEWEELKANAKVIAKSPEMVEMLKKCRDFLRLKSYGTKLIAQINDLLNGIEGDND